MTPRHRRGRSRARTGLDAAGDERGSMAILLMVVLVGMMLSALLVPMIITQDRATRFDSTRVEALDAAQSGLDAAIGVIRASATPTTGGNPISIGDSAKLPCGPLSGTIDASAVASYKVTIAYFAEDPVKNPTKMPVLCSPPAFGGVGSTPNFARLTSVGTVPRSTRDRTLTSVYGLRTVIGSTTDAGGVIRLNLAALSLCMDAGSSTPSAGTPVLLQSCTAATPPAALQVFSYRSDLTVQLVSSVTASNQNGLCLGSATSPPASGSAIQVTACAALGTPAPYTQWSYNEAGQFQAARASSVPAGTPSLCINVASASAGQPLTLAACGTGSSSWVPPRAAGSAVKNTGE